MPALNRCSFDFFFFFSFFGCQNFVLSLVSWIVGFARIPTKDKVWYFITPQSLKHKNGNSMNRSTEKGYYKSTGTDRKIKSGGKVIAMKKSLGYHIGRSPNGERTEWKMYEYRITQKEFDGKHPGQVGFCYLVCLLM